MRYTYTAVFSLEPGTEETYNVYFPDLSGCNTFGKGLADAVEMAKDALCHCLYGKEIDNKEIPPATHPSEIKLSVGEFTSVIAVDTEVYRRYYENQYVKKTLTVPMWLNQKAIDAEINFSQVLQEALKEKLHVA